MARHAGGNSGGGSGRNAGGVRVIAALLALLSVCGASIGAQRFHALTQAAHSRDPRAEGETGDVGGGLQQRRQLLQPQDDVGDAVQLLTDREALEAGFTGDAALVAAGRAWFGRRSVQQRLPEQYRKCHVSHSPASSLPDLAGLPLRVSKLTKKDFLSSGSWPPLLPSSSATVSSSSSSLSDGGGSMVDSCAVIGNGGVLRMTRLGAAIDSHDIVVRLNVAPAGGVYANHVGKKTTARLLNRLWTRSLAGRTAFEAMLGDGTNVVDNNLNDSNDTLTLVSTRASDDEYASLKTARRADTAHPNVRVARLSTRATSMGAALLATYRARLCASGFGPYVGLNVPSSGYVAAYLLLHLCRNVTVYGVSTRFKYHYYSGLGARKVGDDVHCFACEEQLLTQLAHESNGHLTMCTYSDSNPALNWNCGCQHADTHKCRPYKGGTKVEDGGGDVEARRVRRCEDGEQMFEGDACVEQPKHAKPVEDT